MIKFIILFTIIFCIFIELYIGSIMFRYDSSNCLTMNISSMIHYLIHPLHNSFLWNREIIMTNYPFMLTLGLLINLIIIYR